MSAACLACHSHIVDFDFVTDWVEVEEGAPAPAFPILAASRLVCQRQCQEVVRRGGAQAAEEETRTVEVEIGYTAEEEAEEGGRNCCFAMEAVEVEYIAGAGCP